MTRHFITILMVCFLGACAKTGNHPRDPYENTNRKIFAFNQQIDRYIYKPVAKTYRAVTPRPIRVATGNFLTNLSEIPTAANDLLQGELVDALTATWRFVINSTVGIAGLFDVATRMGLEGHYEDFGLTLAKWGDVNSPFIVIPFLGPSTIRDLWARPINAAMTVYPYINPRTIAYGLGGLSFVYYRSELLKVEEQFDSASIDPYTFQRDVYIQRRQALQRKGKITEDNIPSEYIEEAATYRIPEKPPAMSKAQAYNLNQAAAQNPIF